MRKIYITLCLGMLMASVITAQSEKFAFVEEFTQASCPPCETSTPALNAILEENASKVVQLRYQTSWPGVDPMNADNPTEVQTRVDYYSVGGVPHLRLDGAVPDGAVFPDLVTQANIDAASSADGAPIKVELVHELSADLTKANVTVTITNEGTVAYDMANDKLRIALAEEKISWVTPPGSTSITEFEYVMKTFVTGAGGMDLPSIAAGESWTNTWTDFEIPNTVYNFNELAVIGFVQNDTDMGIINGGKSDAILQPDYPDLAAVSAGTAAAAFCDYNFTPAVEVSNIGAAPTSGFTAKLFINGTESQSKEITEELAGGMSTTVNFEAADLMPGANLVYYTVQSSSADIASNNNQTATESFGKASEGLADFEVGFESDAIGQFPSNGFITCDFEMDNFYVLNAEAFGVPNPIGAYGTSDNAVMVNFWQWNPGSIDANGSMDILDQYLVPNTQDSVLFVFDYAYTSYGGSNDQLMIQVSTDCGATFTTIFDESGATLMTTPEINQNNQYLIPQSADQWRTVELDLGDFKGQTILARAAVVSAWGDQLWLDNFRAELRPVSSVDEIHGLNSINLMPNPATDYATLAFDIDNAFDISIDIIDQTGRIINSSAYGQLSGANNLELNIQNLSAGIYYVKTYFDKDVVVNKLVIM